MTAYLPTVTKVVTLAGVHPSQATCQLRIYASTTTEAHGYVTASGYAVAGARKVQFDTSGVATFTNVNPNSGSSTTVIASPSGTVYEVTTAIKGRPNVVEYIAVPDGAGPYEVGSILTSQPSSIAVTGSPTSPQMRLILAKLPDGLISGAITRNSNNAITSAAVTWPDGVTGTFTATTLSTAFPGAVDAYTITYVSTTTLTYTQAAVTRNVDGAITNSPAITVA